MLSRQSDSRSWNNALSCEQDIMPRKNLSDKYKHHSLVTGIDEEITVIAKSDKRLNSPTTVLGLQASREIYNQQVDAAPRYRTFTLSFLTLGPTLASRLAAGIKALRIQWIHESRSFSFHHSQRSIKAVLSLSLRVLFVYPSLLTTQNP